MIFECMPRRSFFRYSRARHANAYRRDTSARRAAVLRARAAAVGPTRRKCSARGVERERERDERGREAKRDEWSSPAG